MSGMSDKELRDVLDGLEEQGCVIERRKASVIIYAPDGKTRFSFHLTTSDSRTLLNYRARVLRAGLLWPLDGQPRKKKETDMAKLGRPRNEQKWNKVRTVLAHREDQGFRHHQMSQLKAETGEHDALLRRILLEDGYSQDPETHLWHKPQVDLQATPTPATIKVEPKLVVPGYSTPFFADEQVRTFSVDSPNQVVGPPITNSKPLADKKPEVQTEQKRPAEREFIDTHDSWAVDMSASIRDLTVGQLRSAYSAAGLELELRVWHKG